MTLWQIEFVARLRGPAEAVGALALSEDGAKVAAIGGQELYLGLLAPSGFPAPLLPTGIRTERTEEPIEYSVRGHSETFSWRDRSVAHLIRWTPDGLSLWIATEKAVVLYDVAGAILRSLPKQVRVGSLALALNGDLVLGMGPVVARIEPERGAVRRQLMGHSPHTTELVADSDMRGRYATYRLDVTAVDVAHDGCILSGSDDGTVRLWPETGSTGARVFEVGTAVHDAAFLDERRAVIASLPGRVFAVALETQARLWIDGESDSPARVSALALSKDRRFLAVARSRAAVRIVDTSTGELVAQVPLPEGAFTATSLCWTRDSSRLLLGTHDGRVALCRAPGAP
jgi:WD40 repeat protein